MNKLDKLRETIDGVDNVETLKCGYDLFHELIEIAALKDKISSLESGLTDGGKAMFYYFAMGLDEEERLYIAEKIMGKINRLNVAEDRSKKEEERLNGASLKETKEAIEASPAKEEDSEEEDAKGCLVK